jgi:hypothetical protein
MSTPDEYKNLARRMNEFKQEVQFFTNAVNTMISDYGYVPNSPLERTFNLNKMVTTHRDVLDSLTTLLVEIDRLRDAEQDAIEIEERERNIYELTE